VLKSAALKLVDIILPKKCICGRNRTEDAKSLCHECWAKVQFISGDKCNCCGDPFAVLLDENEGQLLCPNCLETPPQYKKQRCVFKYDEHSSFIISKFKYSDATYVANYIAPQLQNISREFIDDIDVITSIPLHLKKLVRRKYNQSAILANKLGRLSGKKVDNMLLKRIKDTTSQAGLERSKRLKNIKGSFTVPNPRKLEGKNILLVDDVITTGATIAEATKVLLKGGAKKVYVVAAARTLRD
jgi:ComF family protein